MSTTNGTGCNDVRLFTGVSSTHRTYSSSRARLNACPPSAHHVTRVSITTTAAATAHGQAPAARPTIRYYANQLRPLRHHRRRRRQVVPLLCSHFEGRVPESETWSLYGYHFNVKGVSLSVGSYLSWHRLVPDRLLPAPPFLVVLVTRLLPFAS